MNFFKGYSSKVMMGVIFTASMTMANASEWKSFTLESKSNLRTWNRSQSHLVVVSPLPKGTKLRFKSDGVQSGLKYKASNGKVSTSRGKWISKIMIDHIPGSRISDRSRKYWNSLKLFMSLSAVNVSVNEPTANPVVTPVTTPSRDEEEPTQVETPSTHQGDCYEKFIAKGVPRAPLDKTLGYFKRNKSKFSNQEYIAFSDYGQKVSNKRFYKLNLKTCDVHKMHVAHGRNGGTGSNAKVTSCTLNGSRTNTTRPGATLIKGYHWRNEYNPKSTWSYITSVKPKKQALKLHGLERRNNDVASKGVVFHQSRSFRTNNGYTYRSFGCPVAMIGELKAIQSKLKSGTLYYAYIPKCE